MSADRLRILLPLLLVLASCGGDEKPVESAAADPAKAAMEKLARQAEEILARSRAHAAAGEFEPAWTAWREARDLLGETPDLAAAAERIRAAEKASRHDAEYEAALAALNQDTEAETEEERLAALEKAIAAGRAFLDAYPKSPNREEIQAGIDYAEKERRLRADYLAALGKAKDALAGGRPEEALAAARAAIALLDRPPARNVEQGALSALTPDGMIFVAAGFFPCGKEKDRTFCPAFYVDRTEVTNGQYAAFVAATGHAAPNHWAADAPPADKVDHPVVHVTLEDALAYAEWAGRRLPTEREWERAARGTEGRAWPWGDEWDADKGNFAPGGTVPVGSKPFDRSPDGCLDMGGNVMEITLPTEDPAGATLGPVIKGGHWSDDFHPEYALTFSRWPVDRKHADSGTGFRCAKSPP